MNRNDETPDPRVLACYSAAKAKARELGRWDADHAIFDLLAAELPREAYNAIAWYLATEQWSDYLAALRVLGVDRQDEYGCWCLDVMRELGTWCTWDLGEGLKYGLSSFERWTPPTRPLTAEQRRAKRPGPWCGVEGHTDLYVYMDPRGPEYSANTPEARPTCADCFAVLCDAQDAGGA